MFPKCNTSDAVYLYRLVISVVTRIVLQLGVTYKFAQLEVKNILNCVKVYITFKIFNLVKLQAVMRKCIFQLYCKFKRL